MSKKKIKKKTWKNNRNKLYYIVYKITIVYVMVKLLNCPTSTKKCYNIDSTTNLLQPYIIIN